MANRYWVGGTAAWDGTAGTKWATTSGGAGGAAVPTAVDDVFFDAASGAVTVTATSALCNNLNFTGFTGTFTGSAVITIQGSLTLVSGMTYSETGTLAFGATTTGKTITTAGKTVGPVTFAGAGGEWTLQDALTSSGAVTVTQGTFTTNNYAVTATSLSSSNSNARTINLGSSTVTLSATTNTIVLTSYTGLTFNAGTSTIVLSGAGSTIALGVLTTGSSAQTFYNLSYTSTTASTHQFVFSGVPVSQTAIFNNVTVTAPAAAGVTQVTFNYPVTIKGTLSTTGTAGNRRVLFASNVVGLAQTLTINGSTSLTDADFRDIYVIGTAAPISGTRIGDLRGTSGITFSAPKTVYWATAAGGNWSGTNWAASAGGATSDANFPLAQDTAAIVNTGLNTSATVTLDAAIPYTGTINASSRTTSMTINMNVSGYTIYGDFITSASVLHSGGQPLTFSGRNTQTLTFFDNVPGGFTVDSFGGTVQLGRALTSNNNTLTVTNGTFNTQGYAVTAGSLSSSNSNVRAINLGSSTVTLSSTPVTFTTSTNLTFNAGTSTIIATSAASYNFNGGGVTFYNVTLNNGGAAISNIIGSNTFNNLTITPPASASIGTMNFQADQTITGTLTCAGATAVRRIFLLSNTLGTTRTLTVNSLSATDCDFRDITIAGTAAGSSPTRAGDCGGNIGITFPAPKTVYWNLAGTQNWSATGWASSSGGTPDINNFPLAQDTAVFDDTGSAGTVIVDQIWNIGTLSSGGRTSAWTFQVASGANIYGDWTYGSGVTTSNNNAPISFSKRGGTQTLITAGKTFGDQIIVNSVNGTLQLGDALTAQYSITLTSGTFDAVTYNLTFSHFATSSAATKTLKMGSGTWTLSNSGSSTVWDASSSNTTLYKGTANIVLSSTSTSARTFNTGGLSYNKLTIGGATGTSTLTIAQNGQFTELASTKTVAHTIALGTTAQTLGAWTVTGTAGNVVTVSGTATITIAGARVSGVDYLAMGTTTVLASSPGEFYAGANSTGTGTGVILTAAPSPVTRYWRGGSGTWDATTTTNWSATSGGAGGASVPTSADAVVFDSASNATAYTVTCTATLLRCASLTIAGPASGNVTFAGTAPLAIHDNVSLSATGITLTYTGNITLSGSSTGRTFTTNGVALASAITVNGVGCGWTLGSSLDVGASTITFTNGSFSASNYNVTAGALSSANSNTRSITFGSGTITLSGGTAINFGTTQSTSVNLTFNAGTSQIVFTSTAPNLVAYNPSTFYSVSFTSTAITTASIFTPSTFTNLTFAGRSSAGISTLVIDTFDFAVTGTLNLSAGADATCRTFVRSLTIGTPRTITCASVASLSDIDFRDITIAGAAAPVSGTRLGNCKGNSGITFPAGKTVYYRATNGDWTTGWSLTSGGAFSADYFPLAQDTIVFPSSPTPYPSSGNTVTLNANYSIGTIDMSARTSNTMTLATSTQTPTIYGNWINGTGTTLTGTGTLTFAGRGSQTITSAGKTFTQGLTITSPSGSVTMQDAFSSSASPAITLTAGTFDANGYNFTGGSFSSSVTTYSRTAAIGSGTWTLNAAVATPWSISATNLTVTGTGTISLTSASAKTFSGGGISYSGITLDQGGAGQLTIGGNNTFKNITNSYGATGETTIALGGTTQTVTQFTASGTSGKLLNFGTTVQSTGNLILTSGTVTTPNYLRIQGVRAYALTDTWYAGNNSINSGSLGWIFASGAPVVTSTGNFFLMF